MNKFKLLSITLTSLAIATIIVTFSLLIYYEREPWIIGLISILVILIDVGFGIYIMNSKRHIYTKACWLFVIILLPLVGCFLFVVFGSLPMKRKDWKDLIDSQTKFNKYENYEYVKEYLESNKENIDLFHYNYRNELKPIYQCNDIQPIDNNTALLENVIRLIRSAKKFIHLETYVVHDGFFFRIVAAELIKQAQKGIKIRFIYDWLGSFLSFKNKQMKELKKAGIEIGVFNPPGLNIFKGATNYRLHRKVLIIDNKYAIYGGSNVGDEYLSIELKKHYWRDQNFLIEGEIVNSLNISFINDWIDFTDYTVSNKQRNALLNDLDKYLIIHKANNKVNMQFFTSAPNVTEKSIMNTIATMILRAKRSIKIVTPYFVPTELCSSALGVAARSGIKVQIILPGKPDNKNFIITVNRGQYLELLNMPCEIYEFNGFIHSKYLIVDNEYVLITTANFDYRSFLNNFESGILIHSSEFAKKMNNIFEWELNNSQLIELKEAQSFMTFSVKFRLMIFTLYKPLL